MGEHAFGLATGLGSGIGYSVRDGRRAVPALESHLIRS